MTANKTPCLYCIVPEVYDPARGYPLCIIWQNTPGIHVSQFFCGHDYDLAVEYANDLNTDAGFNQGFATLVYEAYMGISGLNFFHT
jgi:hypothetical protein